jgi:para-nitrobenzyl esterase
MEKEMSVLLTFTLIAATLASAEEVVPAAASAAATSASTEAGSAGADSATPDSTAPAPPESIALNGDTPIAVLAENPAAREILTRHLPDLFSHPAYDAFKNFSLRALQPHSNGAITEATIASIEAELSALR